MSVEYSLSRMTTDSVNFINAVSAFSPSHALFYDVGYRIGSRFEELTDITRFQIIDKDLIEFHPSKGNNPRLLPISILPEEFVKMVDTQQSFFNRIDYNTTCRYFNLLWPAGVVRVGPGNYGKAVRFYIFRYRMFKNLYSQGLTVRQISAIMGEIDHKNTEGYINKQLLVES